MLQDYDFYNVTWKVLSLLNKAGMLQQVIKELEKYKTDIAAIPQIRWKGSAVFDTVNFILMYSGNEMNMFGTIFLINRSMNKQLTTPVV
jgi:hypothetical protein